MKHIYEAFDGTQFDDEYDCYQYEWKHSHPHLNEIKFLDKNNNELKNFLSDDAYNKTDTIIVPSEECVKELEDLVEHTGFMSYESIDRPGIWVYCQPDGNFVKTN